MRTPAPGSIEKMLEPVVRYNPGDLYSGLAMGLALTRANKVEMGVAATPPGGANPPGSRRSLERAPDGPR